MKLNNVLKRSVWSFVSVFFVIAFTTSMVGGQIMKDNASSINGTLKINPYVIENNGDENTEYFSSDFKNEDGSLNDVAMRQNSLDIGEQVASEGMAVLFNKNNALPLIEGSKLVYLVLDLFILLLVQVEVLVELPLQLIKILNKL